VSSLSCLIKFLVNKNSISYRELHCPSTTKIRRNVSSQKLKNGNNISSAKIEETAPFNHDRFITNSAGTSLYIQAEEDFPGQKNRILPSAPLKSNLRTSSSLRNRAFQLNTGKRPSSMSKVTWNLPSFVTQDDNLIRTKNCQRNSTPIKFEIFPQIITVPCKEVCSRINKELEEKKKDRKIRNVRSLSFPPIKASDKERRRIEINHKEREILCKNSLLDWEEKSMEVKEDKISQLIDDCIADYLKDFQKTNTKENKLSTIFSLDEEDDAHCGSIMEKVQSKRAEIFVSTSKSINSNQNENENEKTWTKRKLSKGKVK